MNDAWLHKWNKGYDTDNYIFGKEPNEFLKEELEKIPAGAILFAAEGEGRNAVFAARQGWKVSAFDISEVGRNKALRLAEEKEVALDYRVGELPDIPFQKNHFDAIVLIYAHFPPDIKSSYHHLLSSLLRRNGLVVFEAFSKKHLDYRIKNPKIGGPRDVESLFSIAEIEADFKEFEFLFLEEKEVELREGSRHNGKGMVIRFVAKKK